MSPLLDQAMAIRRLSGARHPPEGVQKITKSSTALMVKRTARGYVVVWKARRLRARLLLTISSALSSPSSHRPLDRPLAPTQTTAWLRHTLVFPPPTAAA
ncbi:hypothetical protein GUJ93_ZPchr0012g22233 [Zizania palustris]|uniref:Uncharacterized protein n=1 Tax=Zizania palustris TaxID=103762 RepID=A0A8J5WPI1_ZIZPA|nr:hypothetical protein GUJ93_ZPchr0012g22233 [Zizania palustris]